MTAPEPRNQGKPDKIKQAALSVHKIMLLSCGGKKLLLCTSKQAMPTCEVLTAVASENIIGWLLSNEP